MPLIEKYSDANIEKHSTHHSCFGELKMYVKLYVKNLHLDVLVCGTDDATLQSELLSKEHVASEET